MADRKKLKLGCISRLASCLGVPVVSWEWGLLGLRIGFPVVTSGVDSLRSPYRAATRRENGPLRFENDDCDLTDFLFPAGKPKDQPAVFFAIILLLLNLPAVITPVFENAVHNESLRLRTI